MSQRDLKKIWPQFVDRFIGITRDETGGLPVTRFDPDWPSTCIAAEPDDNNQVCWVPRERLAERILAPVERALECRLHDDLHEFFGHFWSEGLLVQFHQHRLGLIQIWNVEDEQMLIENQLGHAFAKAKNRLSLSLFIGVCGDEIVSLDNETGGIWLERPGFQPHDKLSGSLAELLSEAVPLIESFREH